MIKKVILNFTAVFLWIVVHYHLCPIVADNLHMQDGVALIASIMTGYDIYFATIIRYDLYKWEFGEITTLPFPYLVQLLCDEADVPEIPRVEKLDPCPDILCIFDSDFGLV